MIGRYPSSRSEQVRSSISHWFKRRMLKSFYYNDKVHEMLKSSYLMKEIMKFALDFCQKLPKGSSSKFWLQTRLHPSMCPLQIVLIQRPNPSTRLTGHLSRRPASVPGLLALSIGEVLSRSSIMISSIIKTVIHK